MSELNNELKRKMEAAWSRRAAILAERVKKAQRSGYLKVRFRVSL